MKEILYITTFVTALAALGWVLVVNRRASKIYFTPKQEAIRRKLSEQSTDMLIFDQFNERGWNMLVKHNIIQRCEKVMREAKKK